MIFDSAFTPAILQLAQRAAIPCCPGLKTLFLKITLFIALAAGPALAQGGAVRGDDLDSVLEGFEEQPARDKAAPSGLDDVLKGFEDATVEKAPAGEAGAVEKSVFDLGGSVTLSSAYNYSHGAPSEGETDWRGLSRLRGELELDMDAAIAQKWKAFASGRFFYDAAYSIRGRDDYTGDVLRTYEKEGELRDAYLQGSLLPSLDIKLGRQIVVWGRSDNIRVTDVLNPMDNREPGMVDIEDLRLPVTMTKLDWYFGAWDLSLIAVHEIRFDKVAAFGGDYYPFPFPTPPEDRPESDFENTEYAAALTGLFSGWDISFYWARFYNDRPHMEIDGSAPPAPMGLPPLIRKHSQLTMAGAAGNIASGNWLIKAEAVYIGGLEFFNAPNEKKSRLDTLIGVEYSGFTETMIGLDAVNRHLFEHEKSLEKIPDAVKEDEFQAALRYQGDFLRDRLHVVVLASILGWGAEDGAFERFSVAYDIKDALTVTAGVIGYQSGDSIFFRSIDGADRLFFDVKYSF